MRIAWFLATAGAALGAAALFLAGCGAPLGGTSSTPLPALNLSTVPLSGGTDSTTRAETLTQFAGLDLAAVEHLAPVLASQPAGAFTPVDLGGGFTIQGTVTPGAPAAVAFKVVAASTGAAVSSGTLTVTSTAANTYSVTGPISVSAGAPSSFSGAGNVSLTLVSSGSATTLTGNAEFTDAQITEGVSLTLGANGAVAGTAAQLPGNALLGTVGGSVSPNLSLAFAMPEAV